MEISHEKLAKRDTASDKEQSRGGGCEVSMMLQLSSARALCLQSTLTVFSPCHLEADLAGTVASHAQREAFGSKHSINTGVSRAQKVSQETSH